MSLRHLFGLLALASSQAFGAQMNLSNELKSGYVLQKGVLQLDAKFKYSDKGLGDTFGVDTDSISGAGAYQELEAGFQFGLSDHTTASFSGGYSSLEYSSKEADTGHQEFRLKRALLVEHPNWGFLAIEGKWFRHTMNKLEENGLSRSISTRNDNGYAAILSHTFSPISSWDIHSHGGFQKALEVNSSKQSHLEFGLGMSKYWEVYRADFYFTQRHLDSDASTNLKDTSRSYALTLTRHLGSQWCTHLSLNYNDNLLRGIWPFMDQEMGNISIEKFGYLSLGFTYRTKY